MSSAAVHLDGVTAGYRRTTVVAGVDLRVDAGELVGLLGPSGAGKTTILRLVTGEVAPSAGTVRLFGSVVRRHRIPPGAIGYVPQLEGSERNFPLTVANCVLLGLAGRSGARPWFTRTEWASAAAALDRLGLADLARRRLDELSGGQFQRVLLARALVSRPKLLLLDEPTSGVDLRTRAAVLGLLAELCAEGLTVVLTTHDLNWVAAHLPRLVCLNGRVVADGLPRQVLEPAVIKDTFGAEVEVVDHGGRLLVTDAVAPLA